MTEIQDQLGRLLTQAIEHGLPSEKELDAEEVAGRAEYAEFVSEIVRASFVEHPNDHHSGIGHLAAFMFTLMNDEPAAVMAYAIMGGIRVMETEDEVAKLKTAFDQASNSRDLWRRRALGQEPGWDAKEAMIREVLKAEAEKDAAE
jgi:hypothetical protein